MPRFMFVLAVWLGCAEASAAQATESSVAREVNLAAMGDWAASGQSQVVVARCLADYVQNSGRRFDAALTAGDNFYARLKNVADPQWGQYFENMYDRRRLNFPFFPSLGNHDYGGGQDSIEIDYSREHPESRWKFPARWYRVDLPVGSPHPLVTVLMLDSNKDVLGPVRWRAELNWIVEQLEAPSTTVAFGPRGADISPAHEGDGSAAPRAPWIVCCAHHPLYSNGAHGDNGVLQTTWGKLFQKYHVDFYICGHDHDLQHLQLSGRDTSFLLVGGGGAHTRPMRRDNRGPFSRSVQGFLHLRFTPEHAVGRFLDERGDELHLFERSINGGVHVVFTRGAQKATSQSLKVIQGLDLRPRPSTTRPVSEAGKD